MAHFDNYSWNPIEHERRLNEGDDVPPLDMTDEQARALIELSGGDLVACIEFANAQAEAIASERPVENVPPDEGGQ